MQPIPAHVRDGVLSGLSTYATRDEWLDAVDMAYNAGIEEGRAQEQDYQRRSVVSTGGAIPTQDHPCNARDEHALSTLELLLGATELCVRPGSAFSRVLGVLRNYARGEHTAIEFADALLSDVCEHYLTVRFPNGKRVLGRLCSCRDASCVECDDRGVRPRQL